MLGSELRLLIKGTGKTVQEAANQLGISRQTLQAYFNRGELDDEFVQNVKSKLGLQIVANTNKQRKSSGTPNAVIASAEDYYTMMVPLVNKFAYAGYQAGYGDDEYIEGLPTVPLQVAKEHKGNYMAFEVRGDSMDNGMMGSLPEGFIAYGREIPKELWRDKLHLRKWRNFIIVTKTDGILIKQITKHDTSTGIITLHSLNPEYEDMEMNLDNVVKLFNVVRYLGE